MGSDSLIIVRKQASNHLFFNMTTDKLFFFCFSYVSDDYLVISSLWSRDIEKDVIWFFILLFVYIHIHLLPEDKDHMKKKKTIVLFIAIILKKKGWVNLLFVNIWCKWDKCIVARNWLILLFLTNICIQWENKRKSKVVIFFLLDYVWERVLGNQYVRIVLINGGGQ